MIAEGDLFGALHTRGEVVFRQGEVGDEMYLIQSGAVEISRTRGGEKFVLALFEKGDFFGEMVLLDDLPRSSTATVIDDARLLPLSRTTLKTRLREDPGVALHLLKAFCRRLAKTTALRRSSGSLPGSISCPVPEETSPSSAGDYPHLLRNARAIAGRREQVRFGAGETIFGQNDDGDGMYIILEGAVNIYDDADGERYLLASLGPRDFFGEMALLSSTRRMATAVAAGPTRAIVIGREDLLDGMAADSELALFMLQVMARRLRWMLPADVSQGPATIAGTTAAPAVLQKDGRLTIAFIALSSCAGCSSVILEDQDGLAGLLERFSVEYCPFLMDQERTEEVDVAVVEGVVRMKEDEEKLREARAKSRVLVAWGTCAAHGGVPAMANRFELEDLVEASYGESEDPFSYYLSGTHFHGRKLLEAQGDGLRRRAGSLDDIVRVDHSIPGCPPGPRSLLQALGRVCGEQEESKAKANVCSECPRKVRKGTVGELSVGPPPDSPGDVCFASLGVFCMGMVTRGGCRAVCTAGGLPCWGCRGPSAAALKKMAVGERFDDVLAGGYGRRSRAAADPVQQLLKEVRNVSNSALDYIVLSPEHPGKIT